MFPLALLFAMALKLMAPAISAVLDTFIASYTASVASAVTDVVPETSARPSLQPNCIGLKWDLSQNDFTIILRQPLYCYLY